MRKIVLSILFVVLSLSAVGMKSDYRAVPMKKATLLKHGKDKMFCSICGMTLPMFYKTNHASKHDGADDQYCSITCLIEDMVANGKKMSDFRVVDNTTLKFISSSKAYFIVGSKKPGTMSMISKYAFGTKEAALVFQKENGGKIMRFTELVEMVKAKHHKEMMMIKKKQAKMIKMGKMIVEKLCQPISKHFSNPAQAKTYVKQSGVCGNIKGKKLQAIGLYLSH